MNEEPAKRARAASMDKGFAGYGAQARRVFLSISDRDLGEGWMRGQAWSASAADGMVIHKKGEPAVRSATDIVVSMTYGSLKFKAVVDPDRLRDCVAEWQRVLDEVLEPGADRREASRRFILDRLVKQQYVDGDAVGTMTAAFAWLIAGSPAGQIFTKSDCPFTRLHYEITDIEDDTGRRGQNFRLVLGSAD
jgi:hypothetical protein